MRTRLASALTVCTLLTLLTACGGSSPCDDSTDARLASADHVLVVEKPAAPSAAWLRSLGIHIDGRLRRRYGGCGTANCVSITIDWLSRHQLPEDGYWDPTAFQEQCIGKVCSGRGAKAATTATTGLALLHYLGGGYTHQAGKYKRNVANTIKYLRRSQTPDGCIGPKTGPFLYGHACCTLALVEAYAMTSSPLLQPLAERAVAYLVGAQHRSADGKTRTAWGETPGSERNHIAVTAWAVLALRSAGRAGLEIPGDAIPGARAWILSVMDANTAVVMPDAEPPVSELPHSSTEALAAMGAFALIMAGEDPQTSPLLRTASDALNRRIAFTCDETGKCSDDLAWYFGTIVQFQTGGPAWKTWNRALKKAVVSSVRGTSCPDASWSPRGSWAAFGGRVHTYALLGMATQVYYRYGKTVGTRRLGGAFTPLDQPGPNSAPGNGELRAIGPGLPAGARFPLEHTQVEAEVAGWLATTRVTQTFGNPFGKPVEAVYTFPLPTGAAVNDFVMEVNGRRIVGVVRPRAEARRIYNKALAEGKTATLLTQERPNVFTQHVANIEPGGRVDVHITYFEPLVFREGGYDYVFPMVVGPRYVPGTPAAANADTPAARVATAAHAPGGGVSPDTDAVPDASRISPPTLAAGQRSGHDVGFRLVLRAGVPVGEIVCATHDVSVKRGGVDVAEVELCPHDTIPNRDLVVRWQVASRAARAGVLAHRTAERGGFFTAFLVPALDPADADVTPREVTFVLDTSGSMQGTPIETSKILIRRALRGLRGCDRFNIIRFAGSTGSLAEEPIANTEANRRRGIDYLQDLHAGGGTEMLGGIRAYLKQPRDPRYVRYVCFLTDGFVDNEDQILAAIERTANAARWFAFGIGSSVNRHLIEGIGRLGGGTSRVVLPRDDAAAETAAAAFLRTLDAPTLVDVTLDPGDLPIEDVFPRKLPDLTAGAPLLVSGRFTGPAAGDLVFRGRVGARDVTIRLPVRFPPAETANAALAAVWARARIRDLASRTHGADAAVAARLRQQILETAVSFRLMSKYTAFAAVDETRLVGDGKPVAIVQPVELPEGVSREKAVGPAATGVPLHIAAWGLTLAETPDLGLHVVSVDSTGAAGRAGIRPGERLVALGRYALMGSRHLESLLWQQTDRSIPIALAPSAQQGAAVRRVILPTP